MKKFDVIIVGDANPDLIFTGFDRLPDMGQEVYFKDLHMRMGGGAALCAGGLAKLGLKVQLIASVGSDLHGDFIISELQKLGVDTTQILRSEKNSTGLTVALSDSRDRAFLTYKGANSEICFESIAPEVIKNGKHIHILGYSKETHNSFRALVEKAKTLGLTVSFDVGWDPSGEWDERIFQLLPLVDVFMPNEVEALSYTRSKSAEAALDILSRYVAAVAIKLGCRGSIGKRNGASARMPSFAIDAVDTTGAGDSFNAGFLYGFLNNFSIDEALLWGNACGALSTTSFGGNTAFPDINKLKAFIAKAR